MKFCLAYQQSGLLVLIYIELYKEKKDNFEKKKQSKWESGFTAVWLKQDPPVLLQQ